MKQKTKFILCLVLVALSSVACGSGNRSTARILETFVALELDASDGNLSAGNNLLYSLDGEEIIPSFRLGTDSSLIVSPSFGAPSAQSFYGFAELPDGQIGFWSQKNEANQILAINKKTGEKTRLFSSNEQFSNVEYFIDQEVFVINTNDSNSEGKCYVLSLDSEPQRVGSGRCVATKDRLWLISSDEIGTTLSELNSKFEVSGRQLLPSREITLSYSGKLAIGESTKSGLLNVYSIASGDTLWSSSATDLVAELLTVAETSDSFIIGIDADDEDGLIDLLWFRLDGVKLVNELLGSSESASVSLSQLGDFVVAELGGIGDSSPRLLAATLGDEMKIIEQDAITEFTALIEPNIVAFVDDEVLYMSEAGEAPTRAMDVYGKIYSISKASNGAILVMTRDDEEYLLTIVSRDGSRWQSSEIFTGGDLPFVADVWGDSVLIKSTEDDGYVTLYNFNLSADAKLEKLAEGNIKIANFGPNGRVYFAETAGDSIDVFSIVPSDRDSRKRVSSRYTIVRFGQIGLKKALLLSESRTMTAATDRLIAYCKSKGLPILLADGGSATVTSHFFWDKDYTTPSFVCVRIRNKDLGRKISISANSTEDIAILWEEFDLENSDDHTPSPNWAKPLQSADDQAGTTNPFLSIIPDQSALVSIVSWGKTATAVEIRVGSQAQVGTYSSKFDILQIDRSMLASDKCKVHAVIDGSKTLRVKVGVYPNGETGVTPFCVRLSGLDNAPHRLVMNPIEIGEIAALTVECSALADQYYFDKSFRSDRPGAEDYSNGYLFSSDLKGFIGLCELRHYEKYPGDNGWGTWGEIDLSLEN